jgi:hypothetical protein
LIDYCNIMNLMFIKKEIPNIPLQGRRPLTSLAVFIAGFFILLQSNVGFAEDSRSSITGSWFEDTAQSDDLHRFLTKNLQYIDVSAVRFRGTRRGVVVGGDYRRKLSDKQINKILNYLGATVPLKPVTGIEQSETTVSFLYSGDEIRKVPLQDVDYSQSRQSTASQKDQGLVLAAWEEDVLTIETNSTSGVSILERVGLDKQAEEPTLRIQTIIDAPRLPGSLVFNRYYKPYPMTSLSSESFVK